MDLPINYNQVHYTVRRGAREEYIKKQEGLCYYCKAPLIENPSPEIAKKPVKAKNFPTGFFDWPIHLHHDHFTGMTIGAVHCHCNAVLWEYEGE